MGHQRKNFSELVGWKIQKYQDISYEGTDERAIFWRAVTIGIGHSYLSFL